MSSQSRTAVCLTWVGSSLLFHQLPIKSANAIEEISTSIIRRATKEKLILLNLPDLQHDDRELQSSSSSSSVFNPNNPELTPTQYAQCLTDLQSADENHNGQLTQNEYLNFLSFNSGYNGYPWGYYAATSLSELPLEFPMLFHSTACMCAYLDDGSGDGTNNNSENFDCCEGENGHIVVYGEKYDPPPYVDLDVVEDDGEGMTPDQVAYTRLFCTEAFYSYTVDFVPTKSPSDATPEPSARPTTARPTTPSPTTPSPTVVRTPSPTRLQLDPTTVAPSTSETTPSPTTEPTAAATTSSPTKMNATPAPTSSPTKMDATVTPTSSPTLNPVVSPTAPATASPQSSNPTKSPSIEPSTSPVVAPTSSSPTSAPISTTIEIDITYGISSNCGMLAQDVMDGTGGITIKEGLVSAAEEVVVEILNTTIFNTTYPRAEEVGVPVSMMSMMSPGSGVRIRAEGLNGNDHVKHTKSERMEGLSSLHSLEGIIEEKSMAKPGVGVRLRVDGLTPRGNGGGRRRRLAILAAADEDRRPGDSLPIAREERERGEHGGERALVYYTPANPIVITQVEDVMCQPDINCMRVRSTVYLELEEGDDEDEIRTKMLAGIQSSINNGALFNKIPQDTVFCPIATFPPTPPATVVSPTSMSPTLSPVATPTTMSPIATTEPPTRAPQDPPTPSPIVTGEPTTSPMDVPSPETNAPTSSEGGGSIKVSITYDLSNDCGLNAEAIMNEEGNTLKEGLVAATTDITVGILNATFPRVDDDSEPQRRNNVRVRRRQRRHLLQHRGLALLDIPSKSTTTSSSFAEHEDDASSSSSSRHRNLVYYTEEYPVSIDNIFDMDASCAPGNNCLLVISTITVVLEAGDDPVEVDKAIVSGMQESFEDGSFFNAIPADTVICE